MTLNLKNHSIGNSKTKKGGVNIYSPTTQTNYTYDGNKLVVNKSELHRHKQTISFIPLQDLLSESIEISSSLPQKDVADMLEMRLFEELSLEPTLDYKICYTSGKDGGQPHEKNRYEVFVASYPAIEQRFAQILKDDDYIDFIFPAQSVIKSLFTGNFLRDDATYGFVHIHEGSAFVAVYIDGEYAYSKPLKTSLKGMSDRFSELLRERVEYDNFIKALLSLPHRNIKESNSEAFRVVIEEFFIAISNVLMHAKRIKSIEKYDAIFISTDKGNIADIGNIALDYFETPIKDFDFNIGIRTEEYVDMITRLTLFSYINQNPYFDTLNFSIFRRPPPLFKRDSGKFLIASAVGFVVAFAIPIYSLAVAGYFSSKNTAAVDELKKLNAARIEAESKMATEEKNRRTLLLNAKEEQKKYETYRGLLENLAKSKESSATATSKVVSISKKAVESNVRLNKLDINRTTVFIECKTDDVRKITSFASKLKTIDGFKVVSQDIAKDADAKVFLGQINIEAGR